MIQRFSAELEEMQTEIPHEILKFFLVLILGHERLDGHVKPYVEIDEVVIDTRTASPHHEPS